MLILISPIFFWWFPSSLWNGRSSRNLKRWYSRHEKPSAIRWELFCYCYPSRNGSLKYVCVCWSRDTQRGFDVKTAVYTASCIKYFHPDFDSIGIKLSCPFSCMKENSWNFKICKVFLFVWYFEIYTATDSYSKWKKVTPYETSLQHYPYPSIDLHCFSVCIQQFTDRL